MKEDLLMFNGVSDVYIAAFKQKIRLDDKNAPIFFSEYKELNSGDPLFTYDSNSGNSLVTVRAPANWVLVGVRDKKANLGAGEKTKADAPKNKKELVPLLAEGDVVRVRLFEKYLPEHCVIVEMHNSYALFSPVTNTGLFPPLFNVYAKDHGGIKDRMINDPMFELI